ncbi:MAG: autotransporter domain-containing protein, partial [Elusimicrobiota bacterium]|nr:autotransporter domain-containing protein [Elusimicrobiota bacterium]
NKADINEIQLGLYGGYFDSWFNIRFILAGARQNFSVNRQISVTSTLIKTQSDFDTFNISAGFEAEFPIWLNSTFDLKPFIGANGGLASNPEIKEKGGTGVTIQSGDYSRLSTVFGVKLAANMQKANLYAKVYGEYTAVGNEPKYNIYLTANPLDKWEELGDKIDPLLLGAGIGFDWNFTDNFTLSINADLNTNSDLLRYFANLGITYKFGSKASNEIASAIEQDEVQYVKEPEILTADFESANEDYPNASSDSRQQYYPIEDDSEAISSAQTTIASAQDSDSSETPIAIAPQAPIKPPVVAAVAKKPKINKINLRKKTPEELEEDRLEREEFSDLPKSPEDRAMENLLDTKSSVELDQMTDEELLAAVDEESEKFKKPLAKKVDLLVANFKDNAVELTKEVKETVKKLAENLKQYAFKKITVEGHSDSKGGVRNFLTSRLRARAVYAELREQGIPADKIEYKGVGSQKPVASNKTAYGQQENRRVELVVE